MKEITREFLIKECACGPGFKWWEKNLEGKGFSTPDQLRKIGEHNWLWVNYTLTCLHMLNLESLVKYASFAAEVAADNWDWDSEDSEHNEISPALYSRQCAESAAVVRTLDAACSAACAANFAADNKELANKILEYGIKLLEEQDEN